MTEESPGPVTLPRCSLPPQSGGGEEQVGRLGGGWFELGLEASSLQTLGKGPGRRGAAQTSCEVLTAAPPTPVLLFP